MAYDVMPVGRLRRTVKRWIRSAVSLSIHAVAVLGAAWVVDGFRLPEQGTDRALAAALITAVQAVLTVPLLLLLTAAAKLMIAVWSWRADAGLDRQTWGDRDDGPPPGFALVAVMGSVVQAVTALALVPLSLWTAVQVCDPAGLDAELATWRPAVAAGLIVSSVAVGAQPVLLGLVRRRTFRAATWEVLRYAAPLAAFAVALFALGPVSVDSATGLRQTGAVLSFVGLYVLLSRTVDLPQTAAMVVMTVFRIPVWSPGRSHLFLTPIIPACAFGVLWLTTILAETFSAPVSIDTWWALAVTAVLLSLAETPTRIRDSRERAERQAKELEERMWDDPFPPMTDFGNPPYR